MSYTASESVSKVYNTRICKRICDLAEQLGGSNSPEAMKETLTDFYREYGVGKFGLHKSFRVVHEDEGVQVVPIMNIKHVKLNDLVGYELAKAKLVANTDAFVEGRKANNVLLFGDAGTGKSSCIKAIANEYYERGLRVIELYKHQFRDLQSVITQIKNRNYKFIIYMDDLSFEDFEVDYKYLKAVIEGGLEKTPSNVLIYATSNRRHLIRENYRDKENDEDMHTGDTVQEKLSLAYRFGVTIYFGRPDKSEFQEIVRVLAARGGVKMPEDELLLEANKWELSHGGLSGRTAQQFVDYLLGSK
jgi:predicted AAA+ superfamily ATPase